jgi:hypothetical protein
MLGDTPPALKISATGDGTPRASPIILLGRDRMLILKAKFEEATTSLRCRTCVFNGGW